MQQSIFSIEDYPHDQYHASAPDGGSSPYTSGSDAPGFVCSGGITYINCHSSRADAGTLPARPVPSRPPPHHQPTPTHHTYTIPQPTVDTACDQAAPGYPSIDATIDDDTEISPGKSFTKIWRLSNEGSCTWSKDYAAVWFSGEKLGEALSVPLGRQVRPGESVEISVDMVSPATAGTYQSNWKLRNAGGVLFGIGPNGDAPFWVRIVVVQTETNTPTATPTFTPTITVTPEPSAEPTTEAYPYPYPHPHPLPAHPCQRFGNLASPARRLTWTRLRRTPGKRTI